MKLMKYASRLLCAVAFCNVAIVHAENIDFNGNIVEFSCADNFQNKDCNQIYALASQLKEVSNPNNQNHFLNDINNDVAQIRIENLNDQSHKILIINYY